MGINAHVEIEERETIPFLGVSVQDAPDDDDILVLFEPVTVGLRPRSVVVLEPAVVLGSVA